MRVPRYVFLSPDSTGTSDSSACAECRSVLAQGEALRGAPGAHRVRVPALRYVVEYSWPLPRAFRGICGGRWSEDRDGRRPVGDPSPMQEYPCLGVALTGSRPAAATFSTIREHGPERQRFRERNARLTRRMPDPLRRRGRSRSRRLKADPDGSPVRMGPRDRFARPAPAIEPPSWRPFLHGGHGQAAPGGR